VTVSEDDRRPRSPIDHALDLFVYAPLGFVAEAPSLLPRFARRGRAEVEVAQALGHYALHRDADRLADELADRPEARARLQALGLLPRSVEPGAASSDADGTRPQPIRPHLESVADPPSRAPRQNGSDIDPDTLAILDYESLSASQVVPRLESLTPDELEAVRRYENGNRARRTILNKIAQLQGA
jgi:hypothetical protein